MIKFEVYFILYLQIFHVNSLTSSKKINFRTTSVKCGIILKCTTERQTFIKPFRNGTRLTTIEYNFRKPCHDFWVHERFFLKFGENAQYRQWMFDYDENLCGYYDGTVTRGLFFSISKRVFERISPKTLHACPYTGVRYQ